MDAGAWWRGHDGGWRGGVGASCPGGTNQGKTQEQDSFLCFSIFIEVAKAGGRGSSRGTIE